MFEESNDRLFIDQAKAHELLSAFLTRSSYPRLSDTEAEAFTDMHERAADGFGSAHERSTNLSPKQILWIQRVAIRIGILDKPTENLWSSKSPAEQARIRGRDVPTPAVLEKKNLPLDPPGRPRKK